MALSGTLKDFGIADILQLIGQQQKTGVLKLAGAGDQKVDVTFANGNVVFASEKGRAKANLLGNLLLRAAMVTEEQLEETLAEQQRSLKRLGDLLVERAIISSMQLSQLARLQATETLYRLFHWKTGTYEFTQGEVDVGKPAFEPLRAESILLEGFRRMDEWGPLRKRIPSSLCSFERIKDLPLGDEDPGSTDVGLAPLDASGDADAPGQRHKLLYKLAEPQRSAEKITDLSRLGEFETLKALEQLMSWGFLKLKPPPKGSGRMRALTERGAARARGIFLQVGVTVAFVLAALFCVKLLVPAMAHGREIRGHANAAVRVLGHDQLLRLESALELYRLEHGEYPEELARLVEDKVVEPGDLRWPYRAPYHYRRTQQGFVLLPPLD
jgi:hypothetical protein